MSLGIVVSRIILKDLLEGIRIHAFSRMMAY